MELGAQSTVDSEVEQVHCEELESLQRILATQNQSLGYDETAGIAQELLDFFEALSEENEEAGDA